MGTYIAPGKDLRRFKAPKTTKHNPYHHRELPSTAALGMVPRGSKRAYRSSKD